ncbi:MAG: histidinol-phosphatase HisJ family protein [Lachnospiraceae bacterium]|nr:histidinol-phosphatase HisJ family protein [Lachnospiraceae bacterium]
MPCLIDSHLHTSFSGDSDAPMEEVILSAIQRGLRGLCFTEHLDWDYPVCEECPPGTFDLDFDAYYRQFALLQEKYADRIHLRFGIELGLQPHLSARHCDLLKNWPFDFVIGSTHVVHGRDPYYPAFYEGREEADCYLEYFQCVLENMETFVQYDSLGHLDYVVRYGPNKDLYYTFQKYQDVLDPILKKLAITGKALECNTGAIRYGLRELNPSLLILKRYRQLGGEFITIGSDAHTPDRLGDGFDRACEVLKAAGFSYYTIYEKRKPRFLKL